MDPVYFGINIFLKFNGILYCFYIELLDLLFEGEVQANNIVLHLHAYLDCFVIEYLAFTIKKLLFKLLSHLTDSYWP